MRGFRLLFVAGLFALTTACGSNEGNSNEANPAEASPVASPSAAAPSGASPEASASEDSATVITKEQYDKVENGMSYKEVVDIVGSEGEIVTETGEKGGDMYAIAVLYENKSDPATVSNATFIFLGDKLQTKSQYGLE